uniref:Uncharacterized protein n=1 Tax=Macrostomum lignano TaxID=282301 RepID=A0A1I8J7T0_9PLAT
MVALNYFPTSDSTLTFVSFELLNTLDSIMRDLYSDLLRNNTIGLYRAFLAQVARFPSECTLCRSSEVLNNSIRVTPGTGITDGEICERIFSLLRPYGRILKEMRIDRRTRLIAHIIGMYHLRLDPGFTTEQLVHLGQQWLREDARAALLRTGDWLQKCVDLQLRSGGRSHQARLLTRKADVLCKEMSELRESSGCQYSLKDLGDPSSSIYSRLDSHTARPFPLTVQPWKKHQRLMCPQKFLSAKH